MKLSRQSSGQQMSKEQMSGHMNDDFTAPSSAARYRTPGPTANLRGIEANTNRGLKEKPVMQDISADEHGSHVATPNAVAGFHFKVYGDA